MGSSNHTSPQANQIHGHFIDIDPQGQLRLRVSHRMTWDEQGKLLEVVPLSASDADKQIALPYVVPGAIDCHVHFPQTNIIGGFGKDLLDWLDKNVWPEEKRLAEPEYASTTATTFLKQLLQHGTTSALVFGSQFPKAIELLFAQAEALGMCLITGLTFQDRNTSPELEFGPQESKAAAEAMIASWHNKARLRYAVTPRFSPACSHELLKVCRELLDATPDLYFQTHINESASEIEFVKALFPECEDYLATYEKFHLIRKRSVLAHSVHPTESELHRMGKADCSVAHCPSSNGFLGSGAFSYQNHLAHGIRVGVGTDVGAGVSFSMWNEMRHAHLMQMRHAFDERHPMTGESMLKAITVDSANALHLLEELGNFEPGKWADFVTLSDAKTTLSPLRDLFSPQMSTNECSESLFRFAIQGPQDRIARTYVRGQVAFDRDAENRFPSCP